jgi:AbrB family looped-hinge helix DNA binding protein
MTYLTTKIGKRGTVVIPAKMRHRYGLEEGTLVNVESRPDGLLLRPVVTLPVEIYTDEQRAEFILNNAVTKQDYRHAIRQVREMGLDPESIFHEKPKR